MTIAMMSLNRYFFICSHDWYERLFTKKTCIGICISLYSIGILIVLLNQANIGNHTFDHKSIECIWDRMASYPYTVVFSIVLVWVPIIITGVSYGRIYSYVKRHRRRVQQQTTTLHTPVKCLRLAKTLFIIYTVFSICWIPYALLVVIDSKNDLPHELHLYITMFAHLHPSLNWLIYYITNDRYKEAYREILFSCVRVCETPDDIPSETPKTAVGKTNSLNGNGSSHKWGDASVKKTKSSMYATQTNVHHDATNSPIFVQNCETSI